MKNSSQSVIKNYRSIPRLAFEHQRLTSFAGLVLFWQLFKNLQLLPRLEACFEHVRRSPFLPMVASRCCLLSMCWQDIDDCATSAFTNTIRSLNECWASTCFPISQPSARILATADERCVQNIRRLCRELIAMRLRTCSLARITLDFDGSVISTKRHAENSAVGYNKKHKGWRSYYPLFAPSLRQDRSRSAPRPGKRPRLP